jgi:hypothetical protein
VYACVNDPALRVSLCKFVCARMYVCACFDILHLQLEPDAALHKKFRTILMLLQEIYQSSWLLQELWC